MLDRNGAHPFHNRYLLLAATAGIVMSAYTVIDGMAVRTPGAAISFVVWMFIIDGSTMFVIGRIQMLHGSRPSLRRAEIVRCANPSGGVVCSAISSMAKSSSRRGHSPFK